MISGAFNAVSGALWDSGRYMLQELSSVPSVAAGLGLAWMGWETIQTSQPRWLFSRDVNVIRSEPARRALCVFTVGCLAVAAGVMIAVKPLLQHGFLPEEYTPTRDLFSSPEQVTPCKPLPCDVDPQDWRFHWYDQNGSPRFPCTCESKLEEYETWFVNVQTDLDMERIEWENSCGHSNAYAERGHVLEVWRSYVESGSDNGRANMLNYACRNWQKENC